MSNCQYTLRYVPQRRRKFRKIIKKYLVMHARKKRSKGKTKTWTNAGTGEVLGFQSTTLVILVLTLPPPQISQSFVFIFLFCVTSWHFMIYFITTLFVETYMFKQSPIKFLQEFVKVHQFMHWFILKLPENCIKHVNFVFILKFSHSMNK